jgi:hypothetical protein
VGQNHGVEEPSTGRGPCHHTPAPWFKWSVQIAGIFRASRGGLKRFVLGVKGASDPPVVLLQLHPTTLNPSDDFPRLHLPRCPRFNTKVAVDEILELRTANAQLREENRRLRVLAGEDVEAGSNSTPLEQLKKMKAKELLNLVQVTEARVHCRHPNPCIPAYIRTDIHECMQVCTQSCPHPVPPKSLCFGSSPLT